MRKYYYVLLLLICLYYENIIIIIMNNIMSSCEQSRKASSSMVVVAVENRGTELTTRLCEVTTDTVPHSPLSCDMTNHTHSRQAATANASTA